MRNLRTCTEHLRRRLARAPLAPGRRWEMPRVLPARDGRDHFVDPQGSFWRALSFIEAAQTFDTIKIWSTPGKWARPWAASTIS